MTSAITGSKLWHDLAATQYTTPPPLEKQHYFVGVPVDSGIVFSIYLPKYATAGRYFIQRDHTGQYLFPQLR